MIYAAPHYYNRFCCVASQCADTCCAGWDIMIDPASMYRYRQMKGPLGNRIHNSVNWNKGAFRQYNGRCAFLNDSNLCDLYTEAGPKSLCKTCRAYPRHMEEFEGRREFSLSMSCIEAAKIILGCKEPVRFLVKEDEREECYDEFDFFLYTKLMDGRDLIMETLQNRRMDYRIRITLCLGLAHDIQGRIQRNRLFETEALFDRFKGVLCSGEGEVMLKEKFSSHTVTSDSRYHTMQKLFCIFHKLEVLNRDWPGYLARLMEVLYKAGPEIYQKQRLAFLNSSSGESLSLWSEQIMVYFVYTYFAGAVYNQNPYGKMKLAVAGALMIGEMSQALWLLGGNHLEFLDLADGAHRYSREVEHSDLNKKRLEAELGGNPAFSLKNLLAAVNS